MKANELQAHVFATYITLRYGMAFLALTFPIVLYAIGRFHDISLQDSMSSYYFALPTGDLDQNSFPMRTWFVGFLFAIGAFLYLYKGFSKTENVLLNLAGAFGWGVALFPMPWGCAPNCPGVTAHGTFAVSLFICIALVSLRCAGDTLHLISDTKIRAQFRRQYKSLGLLMIASPLIALALTVTVNDYKKYTFFIEAAGVWAFALYWWRKSEELSQTGAEKLAIRAELEV